ncbi:hypothetical protein [Allonocardiopsis opalescens]|uniref:Uncharacterized protein n=1 Tax=Allonocardiopsis opalescens TaxID=1144618 RepID=A0A2T0PW56_9ACTN|nr:hypothetical protein [Allonocardiopsis opalescens]PRX95753.1 hypothetical protein CLV72_109366 [Allonocardiopsis opalescens]
MNSIDRFIRVCSGLLSGMRHIRRTARAVRSARHPMPDRAPAWPPVARCASIGETTEWLPLDQHVPQGRPAMVRPYLLAHERASAQAPRERVDALAGTAVR